MSGRASWEGGNRGRCPAGAEFLFGAMKKCWWKPVVMVSIRNVTDAGEPYPEHWLKWPRLGYVCGTTVKGKRQQEKRESEASPHCVRFQSLRSCPSTVVPYRT